MDHKKAQLLVVWKYVIWEAITDDMEMFSYTTTQNFGVGKI